MIPDDRPGPRALVIVGIVLFVAVMAASAATAPDRAVGGNETRSTLVGSQGWGTGWHEEGSVYLLEGRRTVWREGSADSYFDVTQLPNGTVMAGFMHSGYEQGCEPYDAPCTKTGFRVIDPDAEGGPQVVSEYAFPVRSRTNSEVHDVERLASGEYLLTDMDTERIVTVADGEITWQWRASSFYTPPEDPTRRDWLHINDVDAITADRYLVSVRNANQLLVVERGEGVVEVINADGDSPDDSCLGRGQLVPGDDGDVRCGDPDVLNHQHNPQWLDEGAVLVADSDNNRVVELHRDEATGEWEPAWTLERAGGLELDWPRDADRLENGNTLVTDTLNQRILEVRPNGTVAWSTETPRIPYEADRVPAERVGGVRYGTDGADNGTDTETPTAPAGDVPVLSTLLVGLRAVLPGTPFWFKEPQVAVTLLSLALVVGGAIGGYRN
ncbi:MAG: aryl-sulfate sulfotransferase [Haloarculaceae archaeon]